MTLQYSFSVIRGWLIAGGRYDQSSNTIYRGNAFIGRLSQLHLTKSDLRTEIPNLYNNISYVPSQLIHKPITDILENRRVFVDYQSQLLGSVCRTINNCAQEFDGMHIVFYQSLLTFTVINKIEDWLQ